MMSALRNNRLGFACVNSFIDVDFTIHVFEIKCMCAYLKDWGQLLLKQSCLNRTSQRE